jgi:alpha-tubulin suppressor-like RCC1 family protein
MKKQKQFLTILFLLGAWLGPNTAQAQSPLVVVAWGDNSEGQTTVPIAAQSGVMAVAAGDRHTVALKNDGTVLAWGFNVWGQVTGTSTTDEPYSAMASPVILEGQVLSNLTAIAVGSVHTVALKNDGTVVAWGANDSGQVTGTTTSKSPSTQTAKARPETK